MAAYARTPSALTWLRVNHLINGLHKQISCKNCLYAVNSYFTLVIRAPNAGLAPTAELQATFQKTVHILLFVPKRRSHLTIEHLTLDHQAAQSVECSIKDIALTQTALTDTSVLPVKEITLGSPAWQGRDPPFVSNNVQASLRPLTLKCKTSLPQLPFSMPSTPTLLCSELTLSPYSQPSDYTHHSPHDISTFQFKGLSPEHYPVSRSLLDEREYNRYYTYLVSIMITMHPLFQHHSCNLLLSNT